MTVVRRENNAALVATRRPPVVVTRSGERAAKRFIEFFAVDIRNPHTRRAYVRACVTFFDWTEALWPGLTLDRIEPMHVAAWIEHLGAKQPDTGRPLMAAPSVKQSLAALRMLFDWLIRNQVVGVNPAWSVRGPRHVVTVGSTPVLEAGQARALLDSIPLVRRDKHGVESADLLGLRDRAIIAVMVYSFARIGAVVAMNVRDYWQHGKRWRLTFREKGGKPHELPAHHNVEAYLDAYLHAAGIGDELDSPLFRASNRRSRKLGVGRFSARDALKMIKRRAKAVEGLPRDICCHTFRGTGLTAFLENGGTLERAQKLAGHADPRTTRLYIRIDDQPTLDEIERIII